MTDGRTTDDTIPMKLKNKYGVNVYAYSDQREPSEKAYIPSIKPYLLWQFFNHNTPMVPYDYFFMDSDVVFRDIPNFNLTPVSAKRWYGSDCSSYLDAGYIESKGNDYIPNMAKVVGVPEDVVYKLRHKSIGAQIVMSYPLADYWLKVYQASARLYHYLDSVELQHKQYYANQGKPDEYPIQKWTAEMWADIWIPAAYGVEMVPSDELDFAWASDPLTKLSRVKIYHDAGITANDAKNHFFKGNYATKTPFGEDFGYVDKNSASSFYVSQIKNVVV